jgi:hypothetical protein
MRSVRWTRATLLFLMGLLALIPPLAESHRDALRAHPSGRIPASLGTEDDPDAQAEMEFSMLRDPRTNAIPLDIRRREAVFARSLPDRRALNLQNEGEGATSTEALTWTERGPNNVGGRTRAFAIDVANSRTLLAGSVAGGIWKSIDDGGSWSLRTAPAQLHGTTCITQDKRTGKTNLWYVGTGEIRGSTTNDTRWGSLYRGDGVFKSIDNGDSWTLLPSTSSGTPQTTDDFDFVIDVATNPANAIQDEVFAATHNGIYRTLDGGNTWTKPLPSDSGFTDVAVTSTGVTYACTRTGVLPRIWRSPDGVTWTNILPATFPTTANRIVIALAPSNPNALYFFVQGANNTPGIAGHQIWKYNYVSGSGAGAGGTWVNRGGNLPSDINTQTGYDMIAHVKPDDENFVVIGGTNLYRSTDGFATSAATTTIGGYPFYPDLNHHPDLHAAAFVSSAPSVYYSAGDGGIAKAADITIASMVWTSLNHGYNVTQFYSVSIAPESGSDLIMAGAQDNGTRLGNAPGASDWIMAFGGDGTVVKVAPVADDRLYTQYQGGQMQRQNRDGSNLLDITPSGAMNQLFVTPIVLDPNNSALLYYPAGISASTSRIWRNDSAPNATTTTGWTSLAATEVGAGTGYVRRITALGISTAGGPSVLYYGTVDGLVMRADNANTATPTVTNITPPGLLGGTASGGFVRCIAVDPTNSNKALVAFGNYNFPSLWYTTNGGASWTDVEGNLAGPSGPSVRWASMFYVGGTLQVFLGTSIGVLSTTALAGGATVWVQEGGTTIGNIIVGYMDYRPTDRTLAIGTHARGVFTTSFLSPVAVGDGSTVRHERVALSQSYPNPTHRAATIAYELPRADHVSLRVYDVSGREVATLVNERQGRGRHEARFTAGRLPGGLYYYVLKSGGATETRKLSLVR